MPSVNIYTLIHPDEYSLTPKYIQISNAIASAIEQGKLEKGYLLPSINDLSYELNTSRDTAEKVYKRLKRIGLIESVPGKGYFISKTDHEAPLKIFLLFNKLSAHKKIIYDSFTAAIGEHTIIDLFVYNNDYLLFKKILTERKNDYTHFVIIPHFLEGGDFASQIINEIPKQKLLLLDQLVPGVEGEFAAVYEDFANDIYNALQQANEPLGKYATLKIVFPADSYYPKQILEGFCRFCENYAFDYGVIADISQATISASEAYITLMEDDLVTLIKKIREAKLEIGKQAGIISYNDTLLKEIILNGITTISTDFSSMGRKAAELIRAHSTEHIANPFYLTLRNSL